MRAGKTPHRHTKKYRTTHEKEAAVRQAGDESVHGLEGDFNERNKCFFTVDILTCHSGESTGVANNINEGLCFIHMLSMS